MYVCLALRLHDLFSYLKFNATPTKSTKISTRQNLVPRIHTMFHDTVLCDDGLLATFCSLKLFSCESWRLLNDSKHRLVKLLYVVLSPLHT